MTSSKTAAATLQSSVRGSKAGTVKNPFFYQVLTSQRELIPEFVFPAFYTPTERYPIWQRRVKSAIQKLRVRENSCTWQYILWEIPDAYVVNTMNRWTEEAVKAALDKSGPPTLPEILALPWIDTNQLGAYMKILIPPSDDQSGTQELARLYIGAALSPGGGLVARKKNHQDKPDQFSTMHSSLLDDSEVTWATLFRAPRHKADMILQGRIMCVVAEAIFSSLFCAYLNAPENILATYEFDVEALEWAGLLTHSALNESPHLELTKGYLKRHKKIRKVLESQKRRNTVLEGKKAEEHNAPENQKEIAPLVDRLLATKSTTEANRLRNRLLYIHHRDARKRYYAKRKRRFAEDPQKEAEFRAIQRRNYFSEKRVAQRAAKKAQESPEEKVRRLTKENAYHRKWRAQPGMKEKQNSQARELFAKKSPEEQKSFREKRRAYSKKYRQENPERLKEKDRVYYATNRESIRQKYFAKHGGPRRVKLSEAELKARQDERKARQTPEERAAKKEAKRVYDKKRREGEKRETILEKKRIWKKNDSEKKRKRAREEKQNGTTDDYIVDFSRPLAPEDLILDFSNLITDFSRGFNAFGSAVPSTAANEVPMDETA